MRTVNDQGMKRLGWLVLAASLIAAAGYFFVTRAKQVCNSGRGAEAVTAVRAVPVRKVIGALGLRLGGKLEPLKEVDILSPSAGRVTEIRFKTGDAVHAGAVLATVHSSALTQRMADHEAAVVAAAEALRAREQQLEAAEKQLAKFLELRSRDLIAERDLEEVRVQSEAARARADFARASLMQQEAMLAQSRALGKMTRVTAPSDGVVSRVLAAPGALVAASAPILALADRSALKLAATVKGELLAELHAGLPVEITSSQLTGQKLAGAVVRIDRLATVDEPGARVEIHASNEGAVFHPGLAVEAQIFLEPRKEIFFVPASAVISADGKTYVYLVSGDKASRQEVKIGAASGAEVEVEQGLAVGDWIIVDKLNLLEPGARVRTSIDFEADSAR